MGMGRGVTSGSALETSRLEPIISLWGEKQGWQAEQSRQCLQSRRAALRVSWRVILGVISPRLCRYSQKGGSWSQPFPVKSGGLQPVRGEGNTG